MKYVIYGENRVAKDFLYIFDKLDILYIADHGSGAGEFCGYERKILRMLFRILPATGLLCAILINRPKQHIYRKWGCFMAKIISMKKIFFSSWMRWTFPMTGGPQSGEPEQWLRK